MIFILFLFPDNQLYFQDVIGKNVGCGWVDLTRNSDDVASIPTRRFWSHRLTQSRSLYFFWSTTCFRGSNHPNLVYEKI